MKLIKANCLAAVAAIAFVASFAGNAEATVRVPASEVPNPCHWIGSSDCTTSLYYERTDSGVTVTDAGSSEKVYGTGTNDCNNCADPVNTMNCSQTLEVTFSESISNSISSSITVGIEVIETSLESGMEISDGQESTLSTECGGTIAPCSRTKYKVYQTVTKNKKVSITHTYTCFSQTTGGPIPPCTRSTASQNGGTTTSTATGNVGSQDGGCESTPVGCSS